MAVKLSDLIKTYEDVEKSGDFSEWCDKLELVAKLQKVTELKSFVPLFLGGPAFAIYKQLSEEVKDNYDQLKQELMTAFGVNNFCAYEQLQRRVYVDGETVDVYLADIRRLVSLIGQTNPEPLLRCAFVSGLPAEVALQLKSIASVEKLSLPELVTRARMIISTTSSVHSMCAVGYTKAAIQICPICTGKGHGADQCPSKGAKGGRKLIKCYNCQELGQHIARNCPKAKGNGNGGVSAPDTLPATSQ